MTLVGAIGLNVAPTNIIRETHETTTSDGVSISFNIYYKSTVPANRPVIVLGHGFMANKEMMTNYAMELAARDFIVANLDWRGHGHSGGDLVNSKLILDLEAVIAAIPAIVPSANMSELGLIGYSMGGGPTFTYATSHPEVKAWIGVAPEMNGTISNMTSPKNALVVVGNLDEAIPISGLKEEMAKLVGVLTGSEVQLGHLYGNVSKGTARQIDLLEFTDHLFVPWDSRFITLSTDWMVRTFDGIVPDQTFTVFNERLSLLVIGLAGLAGLVYGMGLILSKAIQRPKQDVTPSQEQGNDPGESQLPGRRMVLLYYAYTLLLLPTAIIPAMTFFLPLLITSFLITIVACFSINLYIFSWRYLKKRGRSLGHFVKESLTRGKAWVISIVLAAMFLAGFYYIVGLNYLGSMPPLSRFGYVPIYGVIMFFSYLSLSIFIDKIIGPYIDRKITVKNEKARYVLKSLATFILIYSWFFIVIMLLCAAMGSMFFGIVLILMVPIFLFGSFGGIYLERLTRSSLPITLLQAVYLTLLIMTLSPMGSILSMFMQRM